MMKKIQNERGIALVMALMLSFLSLVIVLALLYMITQGTKVSAANKRYKSALEASYGGVEVFTKDIIPQLMGASGSSFSTVLTSAIGWGTTACTAEKLANSPLLWSNCDSNAKSIDPKIGYDATFTLRGQLGSNFNVYAKIVDTQPGNSDTSGAELLDSGAGVAYGASGVSPKHMPALYRIEIQGERDTNPLEKARLSVLYAY
jgi:hypothetical protein